MNYLVSLLIKYILSTLQFIIIKISIIVGNYYKNIEKNYDEMKKYYLMAIENGNSDSIFKYIYTR